MIFTRLATAAAFAAIAFFGSTMVTAEPIEAIAYMMGADTETNGLILGTVKLIQKDDHSSTRVVVDVKGLSEGNHGIHIHAFGDISGGCGNTGPHFNPFNRTHGDVKAKKRHAGDLGNLWADKDGNAHLDVTSNLISLNGKFSVMGRGIAIHANEDDLGLGDSPMTPLTGNSGERWACGVIGFANTE
ncbi:Superoxide dismutase [Cu-Zn], chloroplastic [Choanephora cucurbitarum]|uniref:Superoxide dismutase [Cu-Zn] n=1 Tax=Choanephora cucurbitarum TaxID=101091 RepID=A0A1C7NSN1_9FUNG|nr:Superoxide dismutase [Cu-Zn], chloroplastic [Choanephora cucurbitarum]